MTDFAVAQVVLRKKWQPSFARHPWVFESAIESIEGNPAAGDIVDLVSEKRRFVARGVINPHSKLRIRLYSWNPAEPLDDNFWRTRIEYAIRLRRDLGLLRTDVAARLIFSEADWLSGLVVDRYGDYLSVQFNSLAMAVRQHRIIPILGETMSPRGIVVRTEKGISKQEGIEAQTGIVQGELPDGPIFVTENRLRFGVDLQIGQKTGFYLDQAENRLAAARYFSARRVLDLFCYTGGFGLVAATAGKAKHVLGIDSSDRAVQMARANAQLNSVPNIQFLEQDCFKALEQLREAGEQFGAIVLDPPKFARNRAQVDEALRAYFRINRLAVDLLEPEGILVTCSCSGSVLREEFTNVLAIVAQKSGRNIQLLEQRGASPDHPVNVHCPESEYLKCIICRVL